MKKKRKQQKQRKSSSPRADVSCPEKPVRAGNDDSERLLPGVLQTIWDVELLLLCTLHAFTHDRDRLRQILLKIGERLVSIPSETLRPALRTVSAEVDAMLLFTNPWGEARWSLFLDSDDTIDYSYFISPPMTPYLAFLLAGTDFPFTKDELTGIRDDNGISVQEVREEIRTWRKRPDLRTEAGGKAFPEKGGGAS